MVEDANPKIEKPQGEAASQQNSQQPLTEEAAETDPALTLPEPLLAPETEAETVPERGRTLIRSVEDAFLSSRSSSNEAGTNCGICHDALENRAKTKPCDHFFDLECISRWLAELTEASQKCPLCRGVMTEIHHSFDDQGDFIVQVIGVDMKPVTPQERHAAQERDRLHEWRLFLQDTVPYVDSGYLFSSYNASGAVTMGFFSKYAHDALGTQKSIQKKQC